MDDATGFEPVQRSIQACERVGQVLDHSTERDHIEEVFREFGIFNGAIPEPFAWDLPFGDGGLMKLFARLNSPDIPALGGQGTHGFADA